MEGGRESEGAMTAAPSETARGPGDSRVILFNDREQAVVTACLEALERRRPQLRRAVTEHLAALTGVADAVSRYPPIIGEQTLGRAKRSVDTLVETLRDLDESDRELRIPAKAVLGRSFVVAKISFLVMLRRLVPSASALAPFRHELDDAVLRNVLTLMGEDVFLALIEDRRNPDELRRAAARRLAAIWEYRLDRDMERQAPLLLELWRARRALRPIYGTMLGTSELTRLTYRVEPGWADFVAARMQSAEAVQAIEEFLFGLSYEELTRLRRVMEERSIQVVSSRRVSAIIGSRRSFAECEHRDPRRLYEFYRQRRAAAVQRVAAGRPGPRITVEELLLGFLLETEARARGPAPEANLGPVPALG